VRRAITTSAVLALLAAIGCSDRSTPDRASDAPVEYLLGSAAALRSLPDSGAAWEDVVRAADEELVVDLADQDVLSSGALAAGLVFARTGDEAYRTRVESALARLPGTEVGGRTLSLGRQLAGWILAADLVGYRDPVFVAWVREVRASEIGGHSRWRSLVETHEETASNWGALAGASRLAASLYLGDEADVDRATEVLRGWLGEADAWPALPVGAPADEAGFLPTLDFDESWACGYPAWTPVVAGCDERDGALVEDISRGDPHPRATTPGLRYSWEAMQGAVLQAILLAADGRPEVWSWGDEALRRAGAFIEANGGLDEGPFDPIHHWVPWALVAVYRSDVTPEDGAGGGRSFGFADWLGPVLAASADP
jgi:hypothetical protein